MPRSGTAASETSLPGLMQRPSTALEVRQGRKRPVHQAPEVDLEEFAAVLLAHLVEPSVDREAGVVHPGIDPAEARDRLLSEPVDLRTVADIAGHGERLSARGGNPPGDFVQRLAATSSQHDLGSLPGGSLGRRQADTRRSAGDDDDLLVERFQLHAHDAAPDGVSRLIEIVLARVHPACDFYRKPRK